MNYYLPLDKKFRQIEVFARFFCKIDFFSRNSHEDKPVSRKNVMILTSNIHFWPLGLLLVKHVRIPLRVAKVI